MYVYEDISKMISLLNNNKDKSIYLYVDQEDLDTEIDYLKLFKAQHFFDSDIKSLFEVINFLKVNHNYDRELNNIYMMIGRVSQKYFSEGIDNIDMLESYMHMYIAQAYRIILNKEHPTLKDIFDLYQITPLRLNDIKGRQLNNNNE